MFYFSGLEDDEEDERRGDFCQGQQQVNVYAFCSVFIGQIIKRESVMSCASRVPLPYVVTYSSS